MNRNERAVMARSLLQAALALGQVSQDLLDPQVETERLSRALAELAAYAATPEFWATSVPAFDPTTPWRELQEALAEVSSVVQGARWIIDGGAQ